MIREDGLFTVARFRPETDSSDKVEDKKSKLLEKARKRKSKRLTANKDDKGQSLENLSEFQKSLLNLAESELNVEAEPEVNIDEHEVLNDGTPSEVSSVDFDILEDVEAKKKIKLRPDIPIWFQSPKIIPEICENDLPKLKSLKSILDDGIYKSLKNHLPSKRLFPVQSYFIQKILERGPRRDYAIQAPTGSGKTLAFAVPILQKLITRGVPAVRALIVVPTRVLAGQIHKVLQELIGQSMNLKSKLLTESNKKLKLTVSIGPESERKCSDADIIVTTPGRLTDFIETIEFGKLKFLIIDEADQMEGEWLNLLQPKLPNTCQKLLFSATLARDPQFLASLKLKNPILFSMGSAGPRGLIEQRIITENRLKPALTAVLIRNYKKFLIFVNSADNAEKLYYVLNNNGANTELLTSSLNHDWKRTRAVKNLDSGKINGLVCSDIGARGLDIDGCDAVINYDLAPLAENHIHRSGRTARAGQSGVCITIITTNDKSYQVMMRSIGRKYEKRKLTKEEKDHMQTISV